MNRRSIMRSIAAVGFAAVGLLGAGPAAAQTSEIDRISEYLNSVGTMKGDFVQVAPDGVISEGQFYMRRPGRLRFEYNRPNPTVVVADGFWVAIMHADLKTTDRFPLSETPLNLLLKEDVNLREEGAIRSVEASEGQLRVKAYDPDSEEQGNVTMVFDANPLQLKQWILTDSQGLTTTIALRTIQSNVKLEAELFVIPNSNTFEDE